MNSRHTLAYCGGCQTEMVVCADCGNNCCNASTNTVNGKMCGCEEAYAHQDAYWKNPNSVRFVKDERHVVRGVRK